MKTIINQLAKGICVLLYWALLALFVWVIYDGYITDGNWFSLWWCVVLFSLGCALKPIFVQWIYNKELQQLRQKYTKFYDILENAGKIILCIFGILCYASFIIGGGVFFFMLIGGEGLIALIIHQWKEWLVILILLIIGCILRLKVFKLPIFKTVAKLICAMSCISAIILIIRTNIVVWLNCSVNSDRIFLGSIYLIVLGGVFLLFLQKIVEKGILTFAVTKYVLFLRAFKNDDKKLFKRISNSIGNVPLMKIGDPNEAENDDIKEHWLPMSNWKFFLKFYISKAKATIIAISSTEGVIWEVIQNMKHLNKCVFYYASVYELEEFKKCLLLVNNNNLNLETIIYAIECVVKEGVQDTGFILNDNRVYLGDVCVLTNAVLKKDFKKIKCLDIDVISNTRKLSGYKRPIEIIEGFICRNVHILSLLNNLEAFNNVFITILSIVYYFVFAIGCFIFKVLIPIVEFIVAVFLILVPLLVWFDKDGYFADCSIREKVAMTLLAISMGGGLLRDLFSPQKR